jgi:hypothetical protein
MKISRKNAARLASLTAVGAGAFAISPRAAEADILYTPENITITPPIGSGTTIKSITVTGGFHLGFSASKSGSSSFMRMRVQSSNFAGAVATAVAAAGNTWNQLVNGPSGARNSVRLGSRFFGSSTFSTGSGGTSFTSFRSTNVPAKEPFYKLFKFAPAGGGTDYGWVSLSEGVNNSNQLSLKINGLAYDNTGATIAAGASPVPEPSPLILTGLGMLVLGAEALRRFRAARRAA